MPKTKYLWDEDNILYETDGNDAVTAQYTYSPEQYAHLISEFRDGTTYTHYYDAQGSTVALTDDTGHVTDTFVYNAWGEEVARTGATDTAWRWGAEIDYLFDVALNGYGIRRRCYQPAIARWTSHDPLLFTDHMNLYVFVRNRPVSLQDPSGKIVIVPKRQHLGIGCGERASIDWEFTLTKPAPCVGYFVQHVQVWCGLENCWKCGDCIPKKPIAPTYEFWEAFSLSPLETEVREDNSSPTAYQWRCGFHAKTGFVKFYCEKPEDDTAHGVGTGDLVDPEWVRGATFKGPAGECPTTIGIARGKASPAPEPAMGARAFGQWWGCGGAVAGLEVSST
jgi:RHS repeat-associated protein